MQGVQQKVYFCKMKHFILPFQGAKWHNRPLTQGVAVGLGYISPSVRGVMRLFDTGKWLKTIYNPAQSQRVGYLVRSAVRLFDAGKWLKTIYNPAQSQRVFGARCGAIIRKMECNQNIKQDHKFP